MKQPKKGPLWLNFGSCIPVRPEYRNHVWWYDFVHHRTDGGGEFKTPNISDEHCRECPARQHGFGMRLPVSGTIRVKWKLTSIEVIDALADLFIQRGVPA